MPQLVAKGVTKRFGGLVAVRDPVTWNASGRPSARSAISSPSSTT